MTPSQIVQVHAEILKQLHEASPLALPSESLWAGVHYMHPKLTREEFDREVSYLESKELALSVEHSTHPGMKSKRITAKGTEHGRREGIF